MGVWYRIKQFWWEVRARPISAESTLADLLTPAQQRLFQQFSPSDQNHSVNVMRQLRDAGHNNPGVLVAALLHDIGKSRARLSVWDRTAVIVASRFWPERAKAWGAWHGPMPAANSRFGWRTGFIVKQMHPLWSAQLAASAGCSAETVWLIRHHQDKRPPAHAAQADQLRLLQWADDQN